MTSEDLLYFTRNSTSKKNNSLVLDKFRQIFPKISFLESQHQPDSVTRGAGD
jgi:hypothetical protein